MKLIIKNYDTPTICMHQKKNGKFVEFSLRRKAIFLFLSIFRQFASVATHIHTKNWSIFHISTLQPANCSFPIKYSLLFFYILCTNYCKIQILGRDYLPLDILLETFVFSALCEYYKIIPNKSYNSLYQHQTKVIEIERWKYQ